MARPARRKLQRVDPHTGRPIGPSIDPDAEARARARQWLPFSERRYQETGNPVYAWEAFLEARTAGVAVPPSVLDYFERCATRIFRITRRQRAFEPRITEGMTEAEYTAALHAADPVSIDDVARAVATATEFLNGKNGPGNKLRVHLDLTHEMSIASAFYFKRRQGEQVKYAREHVAAEHHAKCEHEPRCTSIDARTVGRYWRRHAGKFPPLDK